jgi:hypothetical protein
MSGFPILDLVAGMIFIYFLLSIISSAAVEMVLTTSKVRAKLLEEWLSGIFNKPVGLNGESKSLGQAIMDHCSITVLTETGKSPQYIDARNFVSALIEKVTYDPNNPKSVVTDIDSLIAAISNSQLLPIELQRTFLIYANEAKEKYKNAQQAAYSEMEMLRHKMETWYDSSMERLTDDLKKRYARPLTFVMATITVLLLNADSLSIAKYLYSNPEARTKLAAQAYSAVENDSIKSKVAAMQAKLSDTTNAKKDSATLKQITDSLTANVLRIKQATASLNDMIPLGWNSKSLDNTEGKCNVGTVLQKLIGLFATILAIMMGAPFWFEVLNKIANLRGAGNKPPAGGAKDANAK